MNLPVIRLPLWNRNSSADPAPPADTFHVDADYLTAPCPKILWIELTSKCPFDCIFCTRRVRFGTGRNLDFEIYRRLIAELESPAFIGLNYSGESIYYPRLLEAIELAVSTGASTELVTAFSTVAKPLLEKIVASGLDRLAVSLHTMDAAQYKEIYRFGSLDLLKQRIRDFREIKSALGVQKPRLDFCFVAMKGNLDQLLPVVDYAEKLGVAEVSIHPIIGRHLIPQDFSTELASNRLRDEFKDSLRNTLVSVQAAHPGFTLNVLNPDLDPHPRLSHTPRYFSRPLPDGARIHSCTRALLRAFIFWQAGTSWCAKFTTKSPWEICTNNRCGKFGTEKPTASSEGSMPTPLSRSAGTAFGNWRMCPRPGLRRLLWPTG
jgi:MoaA/NifB/PqqE/SkfB family radical SAM enzyme